MFNKELVHIEEVQVKTDRTHLEGWIRLIIGIITIFACVGQSSKVTPVVEREDNALD